MTDKKKTVIETGKVSLAVLYTNTHSNRYISISTLLLIRKLACATHIHKKTRIVCKYVFGFDSLLLFALSFEVLECFIHYNNHFHLSPVPVS